ncbi:MAG: hypothetical protein KYX66_22030 [Blastomonas fulva]|jgi:hypothetical protein|uniref:hypothetical protein n=1 Tax=Blastomonas fulva TaxID=1550728 RepID=UPI0024E277F2|nr:hypothetical protein [Blastomonas fulva]MDK2759407.1 hypothetical protein [Blastomonas fulva]
MADRVSASITIGGTVTADQFAELTSMIVAHGLSTEWDGPDFTADQCISGEPLALFAHETPWGMFDDLEQYCCNHEIPYIRWSGGCVGSFGPERIVYGGKSGPLNYDVDEDDHVVIHAHTIEQLGSMRAIRRYLKAAEIMLPPFVVYADCGAVLTK